MAGRVLAVGLEEAAARAVVSRRTVDRWIFEGRLRCWVVDGVTGEPRLRRRGEAGGRVLVRELLAVERERRGARGRPGARLGVASNS